MSIETPLTQLLNIEHPVMLAPMGGVAGGALAGAVGHAGGFGVIGAGYADPSLGFGDDWLEAQFAAAGNARIGIGFITWSLARRPRALDVALSHEPRAVFLSFGDARRFAGPVKAAGVKLILQVQSVAGAREAAALGADLIVAQGGESGGHGHVRATLPLVSAVVDAVAPVPVVAAGGIADGRGLAAALMLGACGALIGTGFYAASEALAHPTAKARLVAAAGDRTRRGRSVARRAGSPGQPTGRSAPSKTTSPRAGATTMRACRQPCQPRPNATPPPPRGATSTPPSSSPERPPTSCAKRRRLPPSSPASPARPRRCWPARRACWRGRAAKRRVDIADGTVI